MRTSPAALKFETFRTQADHRRFLTVAAGELRRRRAHERALLTGGAPFVVPGRCYPCRRQVDLGVDYQYSWTQEGVLTPNWRERLVCPKCGLNGRMRATIHIVEEILRPPPRARVYLTEQTTPLYQWARRRFPGAAGSEWLGSAVPLGASDARGLRNEDLTRLTFADGSFDLVVCLDVLEHVQAFERALAECRRVLAPGGELFLTVPFRMDLSQTLVRAVVGPGGRLEHRLPPEYHGNPLSTEGSLAFYHFGWDLLDRMREIGFAAVGAHLYWSTEYGYLGDELLVFTARRPGRSGPRRWWSRLKSAVIEARRAGERSH